MRTFNVYRHPIQGFKAVKVGFSWPAFFFDIFWMLVCKLWGLAALWFAINVGMAMIEKVTDAKAQPLIYLLFTPGYLLLWLIPGFKGNDWCEANLRKRGFECISIVEAETKDAAIAHAAKVAQKDI